LLAVREKAVRDTSKKRFKAAAGKKSGKNAAAEQQPDGAVAEAGDDPASNFLSTRLPDSVEAGTSKRPSPRSTSQRGPWFIPPCEF
jgi:hypothetical protein